MTSELPGDSALTSEESQKGGWFAKSGCCLGLQRTAAGWQGFVTQEKDQVKEINVGGLQ